MRHRTANVLGFLICNTIFKVKPPDSDEDVDDDSDDGDMSGCADMDDVAADLRIHAKDEAAFSAFMSGAKRSVTFMIISYRFKLLIFEGL